ncbi:glycosyltransferase [Muribaculum intestinale]|uniref:glycosyltransferase n=1 Tax=Muribaculum intestinale TaxID=1796646 RepID=UPI00242BD53E|nr:glycosyltransferase [Muribaculum intestinale]
MPTLLQINVTANSGSTGRIAEDLGKIAINNGWESWIAYGRGNPHSKSKLIRIGTDFDMNLHGLQTRLFDNHGLASNKATKHFIKQIKAINPDIIHLHNIHGYYINYEILFDYLKEWGGPVVWTLHDCWTITGHCSHFVTANCDKWKATCSNCPLKKEYPASFLFDRSKKNHKIKKEKFSSIDNLILIPVSHWIDNLLKESFFKFTKTKVIHNGIDLNAFRPKEPSSFNLDKYAIPANKKYVLGVAGTWTKDKGLYDFYQLRKILSEDIGIVLVGVSDKISDNLPAGIIGIKRTESIHELSLLYSNAIAFINPTWADTYPTTNLESIACGTPVITYRTGGSPESVNQSIGLVVEQGDIEGLNNAIMEIINCTNVRFKQSTCRDYALKNFDKEAHFKEYFEIYNNLINPKS